MQTIYNIAMFLLFVGLCSKVYKIENALAILTMHIKNLDKKILFPRKKK